MQYTVIEQAHHFAEQPTRKRRALTHQLIRIDTKITDVVTEWAQTNFGIFVEVALAQLDKPAKRLEDPQIAVNCFTCQRIEHDIHATTIGGSQNIIGKGEAAGVINMFDTEEAQKVALLVRSGCRINRRTAPFCNLDRRNANAACRTVNQHGFASFQLREVE